MSVARPWSAARRSSYSALLALALASAAATAVLAEATPPTADAPKAEPPKTEAPAAPAAEPKVETPKPAGPTADANPSRFGPTKSAPGATEYFVDLKDGATVPTKFTVHFGLRGMGVAPAGSDKPNSGHHHLLIDTDLPPLNKPIPNDFNHLHFGAGQTEADVELPPGDHTLQLLLGDKNHIPFDPPVASDKIRIHVSDKAGLDTAEGENPAGPPKRHPSPPGAKEYIVAPTNGAVVPPTFTVRFGLIGMGVAPAGLNKAYTGHHHLIVDAPLPPLDQPIPNDFNHYHYGLGQTEAQVTLPPGKHTLQLLLGDANHIPHDPPVYSQPITITVTPTGKPSARKHYRHHH